MNKSIFKKIPVDKLVRNKYQPRFDFNQARLVELAESIKSTGIIQPIVVRQLEQDRFEIIAGERRWRAAQLAGLHEIDCLVKEYSDQQVMAVGIIENVQRVDLNPIEEARAYQRLIEHFSYQHDEVAAIMGKSRTKITNALRLLNLDERVQTLLINGELTEGHGKILAALPPAFQVSLAQQSIINGWNVRQIEQAVKKMQIAKPTSTPLRDPNIQSLEKLLTEYLGCPVQLEFSNNKGTLKVEFPNLDILQGFLEKLGLDVDA